MGQPCFFLFLGETSLTFKPQIKKVKRNIKQRKIKADYIEENLALGLSIKS